MEVMIGIDPHKRSHTATMLDRRQRELRRITVRAGSRQVVELLEWADEMGPRTWAVESAGGMGYLLSQQLVAAGETVLNVPATLASQVRVLSTGQSIKNDGQSRWPRSTGSSSPSPRGACWHPCNERRSSCPTTSIPGCATKLNVAASLCPHSPGKPSRRTSADHGPDAACSPLPLDRAAGMTSPSGSRRSSPTRAAHHADRSTPVPVRVHRRPSRRPESPTGWQALPHPYSFST